MITLNLNKHHPIHGQYNSPEDYLADHLPKGLGFQKIKKLCQKFREELFLRH